ncbi:hypothetical protein [Tuwongella immobilis]|uniref:Glycosyltransferase RgtA/B/C/D-like domain-containing protein n=1 Tax=Tuwongella immobilis TaxID=692036 RepID=A0A6C2YTC8_9BACT|nr:hypothetical protein [Tuwongella immobilis]VIP04664.1 unnamed protein product [Tuwongella immobilis]VTS06689.1 unnamed protein product [Tuwongella immobilis]
MLHAATCDLPNHADAPAPPQWKWLVLVLIVAMVEMILFWPFATDYLQWLRIDQGAAMRLDQLLARGLIPTIDFTYFYGPLGLMVTRFVMGCAGPEPLALILLQYVGGFLMSWQVWRLSEICRWGGAARTMMAVWLFWIVIPIHLSTVHLLEKIFLLASFQQLASGNRSGAWVWAITAAWVKAGLGYLLLAGLFALELHSLATGRRTRVESLRMIRIPILWAVIGTLGFLAIFGRLSLWQMLWPSIPRKFYQDEGYGFFRPIGRVIWDPAANSWMNYLFEPFASWILLSVGLLVGAGVILGAWRRFGGTAESDLRLLMGGLAGAGMFLLYGHPATWFYFCTFTFVASAGWLNRLSAWPRLQFQCVGVAILATLPPMLIFGGYQITAWQNRVPLGPGEILGQSPKLVDEYHQLLQRNPEPFVVLASFPESVFDPRFIAPECGWLTTMPVYTPREQAAVRAVTQGRRLAIPLPQEANEYERIQQWPLMRELLAGRKSLWRGKLFELFDVPSE